MNLILLFSSITAILFLSPINTCAQDTDLSQAKSNFEIGDSLIDADQYDKAMKYYRQALTISRESKKEADIARALHKIGDVYHNQEQYDKALEYYQKALIINQELGEKAEVASNFVDIGKVHYNQEQYDKALEYYQKALSINQKLGEEAEVASNLVGIGHVHYNQEQYDKALEYYQQALSINQKLGEEAEVALNLVDIGHVYYNPEQYDKTLDYYQKALSINQKLGEEAEVASNLVDIGHVHYDQEQYDEALEYYQKALIINQKMGEEAEVASNLADIGDVYYFQDQYDKAKEYYQKALIINQKMGEEAEVASNLVDIGHVHYNQEQYDKALEYYQKTLIINQELGEKAEVASNLVGIGHVHYNQEQYDKALEYYQKALSINQKLGEEAEVASNFVDIGKVHYFQDQSDKALEYYQKAVIINQKLGEEAEVASNLVDIGNVHYFQDQYDKAMEYYQKALIINQKMGKEAEVASNLVDIGHVYYNQEQYDKALNPTNQAMTIYRKLGREDLIATCALVIGATYFMQGQYDKAMEYCENSLAINQKLGYKDDIAVNHHNIAEVYHRKKQYASAIKHLKKSIDRKEEQRTAVPGDAKRDFLSTEISTYRALTSSYLLNKEPAAALESMEQSRARFLAERLSGIGSKNIIPTAESVRNEMKDQAAILVYSNQNSSINFQLLNLGHVVLTKSAIHGVEIPTQELLKSLLNKYDSSIQAALKTQHSIIILKNKTKKHFFGRQAQTNGMEKVINYYRQLLTNPSPDNEKARQHIARTLYDILIKPLKAYHKNKEELIIVPAGILAFLPFETLIDEDGNYLVEKHIITYVHSLKIMKFIRNRRYLEDRKPMLALGGAIYKPSSAQYEIIETDIQLSYLTRSTLNSLKQNDTRSANEALAKLGYGAWSNLPGSKTEVQAISNIVKNSTVLFGEDVNEYKIKKMSTNGELEKYRILHFATHGLTVPEFPELSSIVLSQTNDEQEKEDGYLRMEEIEKLKLKADFINLSACQTGLGKLYAGEGVVGLAHAFLIAGANALSVSLWSVQDSSTTKFMVGVYQLVEEKGLTHAKAINTMKRAFIRGQIPVEQFDLLRGLEIGDPVNSQPNKLSHPFYWAPFVYYGMN